MGKSEEHQDKGRPQQKKKGASTVSDTEGQKAEESVSGSDSSMSAPTASEGTPSPSKKKKRLSPLRKATTVLLLLMLLPIIFSLIAIGLLYIPAVQNAAVGFLENQVSKSGNMKLEIGTLRLKFPLRLHLKDVTLIKASGDTLVSLGELSTGFPVIPLLSGNVESNRVAIGDIKIYAPNADSTFVLTAAARKLEMGPVSVNLQHQSVDVGTLLYEEGYFTLFAADTTKSEAKEPLQWKISVNRIDIKEMLFDMKMPLDSLFAHAATQSASIDNFSIALDSFRIEGEKLDFKVNECWYAQDSVKPTTDYVDYTHIFGSRLEFEARNFVNQKDFLKMEVDRLALKERTGAEVKKMHGVFHMEDLVIVVQNFGLLTPSSRLEGNIRLPLSIFKGDTVQHILAGVRGKLSTKDLYYYTTFDLEKKVGTSSGIASRPFDIDIYAEGDMNRIALERFYLKREGMISLSAKGKALYPLTEKKRSLSLNIKGEAWHEVEKLFPSLVPSLAGRLTIPDQTLLNGKIAAAGSRYSTELELSAPHSGTTSIKGSFVAKANIYDLNVATNQFNVASFLPTDSIGIIDLTLKAKGRSFDIFANKAESDIDLNVSCLQYKGKELEHVMLTGTLHEGKLKAQMDSKTPSALLNLAIDGEVADSILTGTLSGTIDTLDLGSLGLVQDSLVMGFNLDAEFGTNLTNVHDVSLRADSILIRLGNNEVHYDSLFFAAYSLPDTLFAAVDAGDLYVDALIEEGLNTIGSRVGEITKQVKFLLQDSIDGWRPEVLLRALPRSEVVFSMGTDNPLRLFLSKRKMHVDTAFLTLTTRPEATMINLTAKAIGIRQDTMRIDSVELRLFSDFKRDEALLNEAIEHVAPNFVWAGSTPQTRSTLPGADSVSTTLLFEARAAKSHYRNQQPFNIALNARTNFSAIELDGQYRIRDSIVHKVEVLAFRNATGYGLTLIPEPIYVMGKSLLPSTGNAVFYDKQKGSIKADLVLKTAQNGEIKLLSDEQSEEGSDRINLLVRNLQLSLLNGIGGIEQLDGITFADLLFERDKQTLLPRVIGDLSINELKYNKNGLGNIGTAIFYEPRDNRSHYINAQFNYNGNLTLVVDGKYSANNKTSPIDANISIKQFPLPLINPIIGKSTATVTGFIEGDLMATGTPSAISINGGINPLATFVYLPQLGETVAIETEPILFEGDKLVLKELKMRVVGKENPVSVKGLVHLFGPRAMYTDLNIRGTEMEMLDSKRSRGQLLYGKIIASADLSLRGKATSPVIRGGLKLLGGTNATYVYAGNKLKATNNMAGVVAFTDFSDTLFHYDEKHALPTFGGADIALNLHIDPAVRLGVDLDASHQDYVTVMGGGDLRLTIPPFSEMSLLGNYGLSGGGTIRYNFPPPIGKKTFQIAPSSRLVWSGPIAMPGIDFKAINRVRADVVENKQSRKVDFDVLIVVKESDDGFTVAFDLEAPDDLSIQNRLTTMSSEERGKQAVALMVTGTFLAGEQSKEGLEKLLSNMAVGGLNDLTGKLLEGTDFNVGMELHGGAEGGKTYTDYTYSFSKRFYDDRIRVVFGGKVAAGNLPANYEQTFIDNAALEYRLDRSGSQYISLFHKRNNDNLLEGIVTETGVSYILRKKSYKLGDLFRRNTEQPLTLREEPSASTVLIDSLQIVDSIKKADSMRLVETVRLADSVRISKEKARKATTNPSSHKGHSFKKYHRRQKRETKPDVAGQNNNAPLLPPRTDSITKRRT